MATAAVIGCGDVSSVHLAAIAANPAIELVAVCDTDPGRLAAAVVATGVAGFADHRDLLERVRPDVVHVCTPHHEHVQISLDCLEAGVAVILEKPLAHSVADGERLVAAAAARPDIKIGVCLQNRYNAPVQAMHRLLASGELGLVRGASATVMWHRTPEYYRSRPWRGRWATSGGGLLMNQAVHTVDLLQWLVGDVVAVTGNASNRSLTGVIEVEDTADMMLTHAGGARSVFYATLAHVIDSPVMVEIVTAAASLRLRRDLVVTYADGRAPEIVTEVSAASAGRDYWGVSHGVLIDDFYARLGEPEPFWIGPAEAAKSLRVIQDLYAASASATALSPASAVARAPHP